jgi:hypothetical protein
MRESVVMAPLGRAGRRVAIACLLALSACAAKTPSPGSPGAPPAPPVPPPVAGVPSGPAVELTPAVAARTHQLGTIAIGSFDRMLENGTKLVARAMPLPMDAKGVRDLLFSQAGLSAEIAASLDLSAPCSAVFVAIGKGDDGKARTGVVMAVAARGPAEAEKVIAALGKKIMVRGPVTLIDNGAKSQGWVYRAGNVIVLSDELEGIARGALLALEARRAGPEDITATVYPEAIARANGTDVKTAIAKAVEEMRTKQDAGAPTPGPVEGVDVAVEMLGMLADADVGEIGLVLDPVRGLVLRGRLLPRPGTRLATVAKEVVPFQIDPAVSAGAGPQILLGASSIGPFWRRTMSIYRNRLVASTDKGAQAALAYYDAFLAALGSQQSAAIVVQKQAPYLTGLFSTTLTDAAAAAKVAATLAKLDKAAVSALVTAQLGTAALFDLTSKQEKVGKLKTTHCRLKLKKMQSLDADVLKRLMALELDVYWTVDGQRMLVAFGRDAKARLLSATSGAPPQLPTAGALAEARAEAKNRDAFYFADVTPMLSLLASFSDDKNGRLAALARAGAGPIPLVFTAGGDGVGKAWTADFTIPVAAFSSVGTLIMAGAAAGQ